MARQVVVELIGDPRKFTKSLDEATKKTDTFGAKLKSVSKIVVAGGALIGGAALLAGKEIFDMGAKMQALDAKAQTVFGSSLGVVEDWAKESAHAMGLTQREAKGLAANFGDLLVPMGFTKDQAAKMSTEVIGLSGALSEWSGGTKSAAEVSEVLAKAMLGERDGLKELGISISEADVQARLLAKGQQDLTGSALEQAKAMATQELIFAKSTDAQKAYADGTAQGIRTQAEMQAKLKEVGEELITAFYPALLTIATFLADNLPGAIQFARDAIASVQPVLQKLAKFFGEVLANIKGFWDKWGKDILNVAKIVFGYISSTIKNAMTVIQGVIKTITSLIKGDWKGAWDGIKQIVSGVWDQIKNVVSTALTLVKNVISTIWNSISTTIKNVLDGIWKKVTSTFNNIVNTIRGMPGKITSAASGMFNGILKAFKSVINSIIRGWNSLKFTLPSATIDFGPLGKQTIGGFTLGTPNLPYLHSGGIVPGTSGEDVLAVLQAGERVIPRNRANGGETIIVQFNAPVFADELFMDDLARKLAMRLRTVGG